MKRQKIRRLLTIGTLLTTIFSTKVFAADYYTWSDRKLNGGVGNYGYNNRYYYIDSSTSQAGNATLTKNAMDSWIYTSDIVSTPISFLQTSTKSQSIMDVYSGDYFPAIEGVFAQARFYVSSTRIYPWQYDGSNWGWTQICINSKNFNLLSISRQQGVIAHEMGHCMGLAHNPDRQNVIMWPYGDTVSVTKPTASDLFGINHLY